ncbi:MAG TPA: hypothetical protein VJM75_11605, partial [Acidimicrobiales bacterium]|nr:hypothetical protein [Acidimicrobiales bacterium]
RDLVRSWPTPDDPTGLVEALATLADEAVALVGGGGTSGADVETALDCRYPGQSHELTVPSVDAFHDEHRRRNGYSRPGEPVEVVAVRAIATGPAAVEAADLPVERRLDGRVTGPIVIAEPDCTIWVADGWAARAGRGGAIVMRREVSS